MRELINDPERLRDMVFNSGQIAYENKQERKAPFETPELQRAWYAGFDKAASKQTHAQALRVTDRAHDNAMDALRLDRHS